MFPTKEATKVSTQPVLHHPYPVSFNAGGRGVGFWSSVLGLRPETYLPLVQCNFLF